MDKKKKKMNIEEAMDVIKAIDGIYQLQSFTKRMNGDERSDTDIILDRFHEAVLVIDNYIAMHSIDITERKKK